MCYLQFPPVCVCVQKVSLETDLHETVSMSLADSLRVLLEHGLLANGRPVSFTEGCLPAWLNWGLGDRGLDGTSGECPAWRVFMHYFKMKVREREGGRDGGREGGGEGRREGGERERETDVSYRMERSTASVQINCFLHHLVYQ